MPLVINSASMSLPIPIVGVEPGPTYAQDINNCLTIIDGHNHSPGYGVLINPDGLDINSDLAINDNNLTTIRSARFQPQVTTLSAPQDLGCLYEVVQDLYFNDGAGNQIRITQGGGVAGTPGSISGLLPPASVFYSTATQTFIFQSNVNTAANLDVASIILRDTTAGSNGLTLSAPSPVPVDYTITLPTLPLVTNIVTMDPSGTMAANWNVDGVTIVQNSGILSVGSLPGSYTTYEFKINGNYGGLTTPATGIDGLCFFNANASIVNIWAYIESPGSSGTTTLDLKLVTAPGGSFSSIFSTKPAFASTAATYAYIDANGVVSPGTGVTAPVLSTTTINAGSALRFDLTSVMPGATAAGIVVQFQPA